jgi:phospholipid/cholesterol/gamma-HCH transport system substrate-binding protein
MAVRTEVKVGAFVAIGLAVIGLMVFMIGGSSRLFESKATYMAAFEDVEGLGPGASVLMGGVHIGHVDSVRYPEDATRSEVLVELAIVRSEARRIRADSRVLVSPKGFLGDKLITITIGSPGESQLAEGSVIPSGQSQGLMAELAGLGEKAGNVLGNLEKTSHTIATEEFRDDVQVSMRSVRNVLESLDQGDGYLPRLMRDGDEAGRLSRAVANLEKSTLELNRVLRRVDTVVARVADGPGFAHQLIYGDEGTKSIEQIGNAADEIAKTLQGIREGDGIARNILFGGGDEGDAERAMADLAAITSDLRAMVRDVKQGKGTLGALMVDPSVYEDLKVLLGNVQRNEVLRALVRYSIQRDEKAGGPKLEATETLPAAARGGLPSP